MVFYDREVTSDFDDKSNTLNFQGACLLRESDRIKNLEAQLAKQDKAVSGLVDSVKAAQDWIERTGSCDMSLVFKRLKAFEESRSEHQKSVEVGCGL